jgi:hypothetical protein
LPPLRDTQLPCPVLVYLGMDVFLNLVYFSQSL